MRNFYRLVLAIGLLALTLPITSYAQDAIAPAPAEQPIVKPVKKTKAAKTKSPVIPPEATSATTTPSSASTAVTVPVGTATPVAPVSEKTPPKEGEPTKSSPTTVSVKAGGLEISHASAAAKGDMIDIFMSIQNSGAIADILTSAETSIDNGGVVFMTKGKDGKETETPNFGLPEDKTSELASGGTWLRIRGVKKVPKSGQTVPLDLHFRRSPNATLNVEIKSHSGSFLGGFFGQ